MGVKAERSTTSPECLSYDTLMHCLLESDAVHADDADRCWSELHGILSSCGRDPVPTNGPTNIPPAEQPDAPDGKKEHGSGQALPATDSDAKAEHRSGQALAATDSDAKAEPVEGDGTQTREQKSAWARKTFVAALAEWVNMHDLHEPFANGPPSAEQSCAVLEHGRLCCNKLYPRKILLPGQEEISEDPRRRDLFRLWLARNCKFLNNFVPIAMLAMLSNCDFQATLSKDAVVEYMTKYLTKSGQGSLVKVMEHSFSLCMEKAREQNQGSGSAMLRWFNLQSITEVKSQLETMHLIFGAPRWLCSREFKHLWLRNEMRKVKSPEDIAKAESRTESIATKSEVETYWQRVEWVLPCEEHLRDKHPLTKLPFWKEILQAAGRPVSDSDRLPARMADVEASWSHFLELLSWWQLKRYFNQSRVAKSIKCRPQPDVVIVHPEGRFTTAMTAEQWREACIHALVAYCNHGPCCASTTFVDLQSLESLSPDALEALMHDFVTLEPQQRLQRRMAQCPPHLRRNYLLGDARRRRAEERKLSCPQVAAALPKVKYVFADDEAGWMYKQTADMDSDELQLATEAWRLADAEDRADTEEAARLCQPDDPDQSEIHAHMKAKLHSFKVEHRELHNATLAAGLAVPARPSWLNYFTALHAQFGDHAAGFLPQNLQTHTKKKVQDVLKALFERPTVKIDPNFGGKLDDTKSALAQRLAARLGEVMDAGRHVQGASGDEDSDNVSELGGDDDLCRKSRARNRPASIRPKEQPGEVPHNAVITAEQAESALGRNLATEWDEDLLEQVDMDQRAEEEELTGRMVHPASVDYSFVSWCPASSVVAPDAVSAKDMGWHPPLTLRTLARTDFVCDRDSVRSVLEQGIRELEARCTAEINDPRSEAVLERDAGQLDPTQRLVYDVVTAWAQKRLTWRGRGRHSASTAPPALRLLLLGTAGTGKTHTAKLSIRKVRRLFGRYGSVLTLAFSGVAAANLGGGSRTIDSVFHTNADGALEDLIGEKLDRLVEELRHVELVLIDEISTVGAAQLEIMNRRLQQVARVLHRERFGREPPDDMGLFGGLGVVLMGDFAQLPPVLASSLLAGTAIVERPSSGLHALALAGRQSFRSFSQVIRLRRIHRQKGADAYKESTMRLRDAAITVADYELWKEHELDSIDPSETVPWEGGESLLECGLTLVADNKQAGAINGKRLAATAPLAEDAPASVSAMQTIVRCEARHSHPKGECRKSDDFRNVRKALHIRVGARVTLCLNHIWDVPTVPLGLMNGARGIVVAISYAPPGSARADGLEMAGTGFPRSDGCTLPRGLDNCPLPDFVVVHFPEYTGPPVFRGLPRTWIPIPAAEVKSDKGKSLVRVNLPLRLAWALTFHKSQGITAHEGTTISFVGTRMPAPASKPGLPFVGWTRATKWARVAFHGLPALEEFLAVRTTKEFQVRSDFERHADVLHDAFLQELGVTEEQQVAAHKNHLDNFLMRDQKRHATAAELQDIEVMLGKRGVAPVSDSVRAWAERRTGCKSMTGLWAIVGSFRASKKAKDIADEKGAAKTRKTTSEATAAEQATKHLLEEYGYPGEDVATALLACGPSLENCLDFLEQKQLAPDAVPEVDSVVDEEGWAQSVMLDLGFSETTITSALERFDFDFSLALTFLLYGDQERRKLEKHVKRHTSKQIMPAISMSVGEKKAQYAARAARDLQLSVQVVDLGQHAGDTANACFWLCLAVGLTRSGWVPSSYLWRRLSSFDAAKTSAVPTEGMPVRDSHVGKLAVQLRHHMCLGDDAAMLQPRVRDKIYQAFAALGARGPRRTLALYKHWVAKLATHEFADELVVLATACELRVRITCVPYTRPGQADWRISRYAPVGCDIPVDQTVLLGNDDVHYMWLNTPAP